MRGHFDDVMAEKRSKKWVRIRCSMLKKHTIKILKKQKTVTGNHSFSRNKYVKKGNEKTFRESKRNPEEGGNLSSYS